MGYGSSSRGNANVMWITLHTAEGARSARALASFFNGNPNASSHAAVDASEKLEMVPYHRAAWTLGPGNPYSDNLEMCAFARWTRAQWLSTGTVDGCPNPRMIVKRAAWWARQRCDARGIPYERIGARAVSGWQESIIDHDDYTNGSNWGSHWDVGESFPWDVFMADVRGQAAPEGGDTTPTWSLPAGHYYGDIEGPARSHGGYYPAERPIVRMIQQRLQELGHAPSYASWADGLYEQPTIDAVNEWQAATGRRVTGRIDEADWNALFPQEDELSEKAEQQIAELHEWGKGFFVNSINRPQHWKTTNKVIWQSTAQQDMYNWIIETVEDTRKMSARQEGLIKAVAELAQDPNITADSLKEMLREVIDESIQASGSITISAVEPSENAS